MGHPPLTPLKNTNLHLQPPCQDGYLFIHQIFIECLLVVKAPGILSAKGREEQDRQSSFFYAAYTVVGRTK